MRRPGAVAEKDEHRDDGDICGIEDVPAVETEHEFRADGDDGREHQRPERVRAEQKRERKRRYRGALPFEANGVEETARPLRRHGRDCDRGDLDERDFEFAQGQSDRQNCGLPAELIPARVGQVGHGEARKAPGAERREHRAHNWSSPSGPAARKEHPNLGRIPAVRRSFRGDRGRWTRAPIRLMV